MVTDDLLDLQQTFSLTAEVAKHLRAFFGSVGLYGCFQSLGLGRCPELDPEWANAVLELPALVEKVGKLRYVKEIEPFGGGMIRCGNIERRTAHEVVFEWGKRVVACTERLRLLVEEKEAHREYEFVLKLFQGMDSPDLPQLDNLASWLVDEKRATLKRWPKADSDNNTIEPMQTALETVKRLECETENPSNFLLNGNAIPQGERASTKKTGKPKGRGRKVDTDPKADKRIAEAWATGRHKTYTALERELKIPKGEVKLALDRHRKRRKKSSAE